MSESIQARRILPANVALTIALCFGVAVLEGFDIQAIGVAAPKLGPELGLAADKLSWIFTISNVGLVIGAAFGGRLADRWGRKPVFIGSVAAFGLFTVCTALAGTFETLFLARLFTGLGFGAALPNLMAVAAEISPPEKRAATATQMFCGMPLGGASVSLLTQVLPPGFDWRILFYVGGLLPLVLVPAIWAYMPETLQKNRASDAPQAQVPPGKALFGEGRAWPTLLLWITFFPTLCILYLILNWLPLLATAKGLSPSTAPQASLVFNLASVAGALLFGRVVDKFSAKVPLTFAYVALIGSLVALSGATQHFSILLWSGAAGFFLMGANYALYGVAASYYPTAMRGTGSGASIAVGRLGSIAGPYWAGVLLSGGVTAGGVVMYMVPVAAVAGIAVFALGFFRASGDD
jgi:AAHS family 3-hydroxyphenylpropionic acid transporter